MSQIFLSYRREDTPGYLARLRDGLMSRFGDGTIFRDVDNISAGRDWKKNLRRAVAGADVVIAFIGPNWQTILAQKPPEDDWVRYELNQARELEIPVIPVRMSDANPTSESELGDLAWLRDLQFFELSDVQGRWESDVDALVETIGRLSGRLAPAAAQQPGVEQTTHGEQSPNVSNISGDVIIHYDNRPVSVFRVAAVLVSAIAVSVWLGFQFDPARSPIAWLFLVAIPVGALALALRKMLARQR